MSKINTVNARVTYTYCVLSVKDMICNMSSPTGLVMFNEWMQDVIDNLV